eukprot:12179698-Karenia_brevis.AAC.1
MALNEPPAKLARLRAVAQSTAAVADIRRCLPEEHCLLEEVNEFLNDKVTPYGPFLKRIQLNLADGTLHS